MGGFFHCEPAPVIPEPAPEPVVTRADAIISQASSVSIPETVPVPVLKQ